MADLSLAECHVVGMNKRDLHLHSRDTLGCRYTGRLTASIGLENMLCLEIPTLKIGALHAIFSEACVVV